MNRSSLMRSFFVLVFVLSSWNVFAITDEEIFRNFQFSFVNPGARSSAMGGAFIALADDATAAEANPAGLTVLTKPEISFEYRNVTFDEDKLNSQNFIASQTGDISVSIGSFNDLEKLKQPSFLSAVFPVGRLTLGFSRQEAVRVKGSINEIFLIEVSGVTSALGALAQTDEKVTNWNFSVATKLTDNFSLGTSIRFSQLEWVTQVRNFAVDQSQTFELFRTKIDDTDSAIGFNVGAIYRLGSHLTIGGVYKRNPRFEVTETQIDVRSTQFANVMKLPDTFGVGIAVKPNDNITITSDIVRIKYSDLTEGFEVGRNVLTFGLTEKDITFKVDDALEFHVGAEAVVFLKSVPIALRQGYYRKPSNSIVIESVRGLASGSKRLYDLIFPERKDENHFTFGSGFVFGPHFQVDWALDLAKSTNNFVVSTVVRF